MELTQGAAIQRLDEPAAKARPRDLVVLVAQDLVALRRAVSGLPRVGTARTVAVYLEKESRRLPIPTPGDRWPEIESFAASRKPPSVVITFVSPVPVNIVLVRIAAAATPARRLLVRWPALGVQRQSPEVWPQADPSATVAIPPRLLNQSIDYPPDLALISIGDLEGAEMPHLDHPVLGRPTRVATIEPELTWDQWQALTPGEALSALERRGPTSLGALDEQLINPIGFDRDPVGPVADLVAGGDGALAVAVAGEPVLWIHPDRGVSEADLPTLRRFVAVRVSWRGGRGPQSHARAVAGLAAAGAPLVADHTPEWVGHLLVPELVTTLGRSVDWDDRLAREEHSIVLRRAALGGHASGPWRQRLAAAHGLQGAPDPWVTVLLPTRRPHMVQFALRQVARQCRSEIDLVIATHGFVPDAAEIEEFRATSGIEVTVVSCDRSVPFGEVLNRAAARARGDVLLKMDDDDWYGPDFVGDLLLARQYSGAELVGCPAELIYLSGPDVTVRSTESTETYAAHVAGGTMLVDRGLFQSVGGFRHTAKYVDAGLLTAVASCGASVYRAHGLGYVLRRVEHGHTWDPGTQHFLDEERVRVTRSGFSPSVLLEVDRADLPGGSQLP
jgi:hypothetical protein